MQKLLVLILVVAAATLSSAEARLVTDGAVTVAITNIIDSHQNLEVHCKGGGTDLGVNQVGPGQTYKLKVNHMATADYLCSFNDGDEVDWFDIYNDKRDWKLCGISSTCSWVIKDSGPCLHRPNVELDVCYDWN